MGEKPSFPKVNLKYPTLEVFAKAVRKSFGQGRLLVRLKKQFEPGQRLLLVFQLGDRKEPVEIIGQVIDRIEDKQKGGFAYGIRFLNFTENKLNRLLAGEELKPAEKKPEEKKEPEIKEEQPERTKEEKISPLKEMPAPAPVSPVPKREEAVVQEEIEIEVIQQAGAIQSFEIPASEPISPESIKPSESALEKVIREKETKEVKVEPGKPQEEAQPPPIYESSEASEEKMLVSDETPAHPAQERKEISSQPEAPVSEIISHSPEEPIPASSGKEPFQLTPPEPVEEIKAEPIPEEIPLVQQGPTLFEQIQELASTTPDFFIQESMPFPEKTQPFSEEPSNLPPAPSPPICPEEKTLSEADESAPLPEIEDFNPMPELLKEAKPIPKIEPVWSPTPPPSTPETLAGSEEEIVELNGEIAPEEKQSTPAIPEPKPALIEPVPEFKPVSPEKLADFLFRFCRMVLNPPSPEQPDFSKQFQTLFEDFQKLMEDRDRIGIYLVLTPTGKDFIIEGAQATRKSIRILLPQELSGNLLFKMIELFDEKELVGIIFRKYLDLNLFQNFILTLGKFNPEKESADELGLKLLRAGIYQFNLIFETDLIAVPEKIKEDTKIILARLAGELKRLKTLAEQLSEEPLALLTLRLEDLIRPISDKEVIAQILEHLPLVWTGQIQDFEYQDLEDLILFSIPVPVLSQSSEILFKKLIQLQGLKSASTLELEKNKINLERLLRRMMARIAYEAPEQALEILSQLFERQLIKYEELPEEIRDQIAASKLAQEFLKAPEEKISQLQNTRELVQYTRLASQLIWSSIALLEKREFKWAQKIFQTLVAHYQEKNPPFPERPKLARESLKRLAEPFAIELLVKILSTGKKEERELSAAMLYATGKACVKKLLTLLEQSPDRNVRRLTCEILARIGENAVEAMLEKLNQPELPWYLIRNLIMILTEIKSPALKDKISQYLKHPHPRVREEAVKYLLVSGEKQIEALLAVMLKDPEPSVLRQVLSGLNKLDKISPSVLLGVKELLLELTSKPGDSQTELLFLQSVEILSRTDLEQFPDQTELNDFLFQLLEQAEPRGLFSKPKLALTPKMKIALIDALGRRKVVKAKKLLSKLSKDKDEQIKKSAEKALGLMENE